MSTPQQPQQHRRYQDPATDMEWPRALTVGSAAGSGTVFNAACLLLGWSVRETSGSAAAALDLYTGTAATGQVVAALGLPAGGESRAGPGWPGVPCPAGLYHDSVSGAYTGAVWVVPMP